MAEEGRARSMAVPWVENPVWSVGSSKARAMSELPDGRGAPIGAEDGAGPGDMISGGRVQAAGKVRLDDDNDDDVEEDDAGAEPPASSMSREVSLSSRPTEAAAAAAAAAASRSAACAAASCVMSAGIFLLLVSSAAVGKGREEEEAPKGRPAPAIAERFASFLRFLRDSMERNLRTSSTGRAFVPFLSRNFETTLILGEYATSVRMISPSALSSTSWTLMWKRWCP